MTRIILALCFVSMATITAAAHAPTTIEPADYPSVEHAPTVVAPATARCGVLGPNGATARCATFVRPNAANTEPPAVVPEPPAVAMQVPPRSAVSESAIEPGPPRPRCPVRSISGGRRRCGTVSPPQTVRPEPPAPMNVTPLNGQVKAEVMMLVDLTSALVDGFSQFDANTPQERFEDVIEIVLAQRQLTPQVLMARVIGLSAQVQANPDGAMAFLSTQQQRIQSMLSRAQQLPAAANAAMRSIFS